MKFHQLLVTMMLAMFAALVAAAEKPPKIDKHGLHLVEDSELRLVYKRPGSDISQYSKVILLDAYVAYRKNWEKDHSGFDTFRVNKKEAEEIKARVGEEFHKAFATELGRKGYTVVEQSESGPDVLLVRPAIVNLDVEAPDTMDQAGRSAVIIASAGQMTLYAELYDSVSGQLIATVTDPESDKGFGGIGIRANRATNKAAEDEIVRRWADTLASHLSHTVAN